MLTSFDMIDAILHLGSMTDLDEKMVTVSSAGDEDQAGLSPRATLIESALTLAACKGIDYLSMRVVAAKTGRSTTAIFQHFGNKDGLLAAMVETAFDRDARFHADFAKSLSGLVLDAATLIEIVAHYVESRAVCDDAAIRVWPELLFNGRRAPVLMPMLDKWRLLRENFWRDLLPQTTVAILAPLLTDYTVMEGVYAMPLHERLDYRLLLRETVADLVNGAFDATPSTTPGKVGIWLADTAPPAPPRSIDREGTLGAHLLDVAAAEILAHGAIALNHRRLTAKAGVSAAMIIYHFGDMERFAVEAIWHALLTGLPHYLDDALPPPPSPRQRPEDWPVILGQTLVSSDAERGCGFYVGYSRIVGQTCLLSRDQTELLPLVRHLRLIEGTGIHHASRTSWPSSLALDRGGATALAIWIKGWAITVEATRSDKLTPSRLDAASQLITRRVGRIC